MRTSRIFKNDTIAEVPNFIFDIAVIKRFGTSQYQRFFIDYNKTTKFQITPL